MSLGHLGMIRGTKEVFAKPATIEEVKLCGCDNIIRITQEVKKILAIDSSLEDMKAVGFYSDDITLTKHTNSKIHLKGTVKSVVEEISRISYEVILKELPSYSIIVSKKKESNAINTPIHVGCSVELFLAPEAVHLLKDGGVV